MPVTHKSILKRFKAGEWVPMIAERFAVSEAYVECVLRDELNRADVRAESFRLTAAAIRRGAFESGGARSVRKVAQAEGREP